MHYDIGPIQIKDLTGIGNHSKSKAHSTKPFFVTPFTNGSRNSIPQKSPKIYPYYTMLFHDIV